MELTFENMEITQSFCLETQDGALSNVSEDDILNAIDEMLDDPNQFVTLTAPTAKENIRYIQSCTHGDDIELELGIEEERTRLVYKLCTEAELEKAFLDFFRGTFKPDLKEYEPVQFV